MRTIILLISFTALILFQILFGLGEVDSQMIYASNETMTRDFNVAATGDWGCKPETIDTVGNISAKNPELVLGLGDYAYRNNATCWFQITDPISDKMKIVIGNHDAFQYTQNGSQPSPVRLKQYMSHFNLTHQYYSFDYRNVHFIAMSTETLFGNASKQYNFVKNDLQKVALNNNVKWIIVFYHKLAYSSPSNSTKSLPKLREIYHPLFEKYGVDLVLQAHNHNYQRTYPLKFNPINSSNPIVTDKNTFNYNNPDGQIFATVGTGGANQLHEFTGKAPQTVVQFKAFGFLNLDITRNGTKLIGNFVDNNGSIRDHFAITKSKNND